MQWGTRSLQGSCTSQLWHLSILSINYEIQVESTMVSKAKEDSIIATAALKVHP